MSDTGAEVVNPEPGSSSEGHVSAGDENAESCGAVCPLHIPSIICPLRRTYVVLR